MMAMDLATALLATVALVWGLIATLRMWTWKRRFERLRDYTWERVKLMMQTKEVPQAMVDDILYDLDDMRAIPPK